jgi:hypothetical protein
MAQAIMILTCIWRCSVRISAGTLTILSEILRGFPQYLQTSAGVVHWIRPRPFPYRSHKSQPLAPILSQMNPFHIHHVSLKVILILSFNLRLGFPSDPSPSGFPTELHMHFSFIPCVLHVPSTSSYFIYPDNTWSYILTNYALWTVPIQNWFWNYKSYSQSVGVHIRGISPWQGRYLYRTTQRRNTDRYLCLEWDSNPRSQCLSGPTHFVPGHCDRHKTW